MTPLLRPHLDQSDAPTVAIGIATYRRPELLGELLSSLRSMSRPIAVRIVVVDNDAAASAQPVAQAYSDVVDQYLVEPAPGIAEARNRFLDSLTDEAFIAFVDDDERVDPDWLVRLWEAHLDYSADVVVGPVISEYPPDSPAWIVEGNFFDRPRALTGTLVELAATNNVLVATAALRKLSNPRFDPAYSVTGGSDSDLFHRIRRSGTQLVWCDEAIVRERVPHERMTSAWINKRARRTGSVRARLLIAENRYLRVLAEGMARTALGALKIASRKLRRLPLRADELNMYNRGLGQFDALRGRFGREYARGDVATPPTD